MPENFKGVGSSLEHDNTRLIRPVARELSLDSRWTAALRSDRGSSDKLRQADDEDRSENSKPFGGILSAVACIAIEFAAGAEIFIKTGGSQLAELIVGACAFCTAVLMISGIREDVKAIRSFHLGRHSPWRAVGDIAMLIGMAAACVLAIPALILSPLLIGGAIFFGAELVYSGSILAVIPISGLVGLYLLLSIFGEGGGGGHIKHPGANSMTAGDMNDLAFNKTGIEFHQR